MSGAEGESINVVEFAFYDSILIVEIGLSRKKKIMRILVLVGVYS